MESLGRVVSSVSNSFGNIDLNVKVPTSLSNFNVDTMLGNQPRGLSNFIAEIRSVNKYLTTTKIRHPFYVNVISASLPTEHARTSKKSRCAWMLS